MIQDQFFAIAPDHPLAKEFYDMQVAQATCLSNGNAGAVDKISARIQEMQDQIRAERGGDASCTVGLTCGANGFPLVDGRPRNGMPYVEGGMLWIVPK